MFLFSFSFLWWQRVSHLIKCDILIIYFPNEGSTVWRQGRSFTLRPLVAAALPRCLYSVQEPWLACCLHSNLSWVLSFFSSKSSHPDIVTKCGLRLKYSGSWIHLRSHMMAVDWTLLGHYFVMPLNHQAKEKLISGWPPQNPHPSSPSVLRPPPNHLQSSPSVLTPVHLSVGLQQHQHLHQ